MQRHLTEYIRRPESLDAQSVQQLRDMVARYPYCHTARILLLSALYRQHDSAFDAELRRSSVLIPDRKALFNLIEQKNYLAAEDKRKYAAESNHDREATSAEDIIDQYLDSQHDPTPVRQPLPIDATQDYISYLMQQSGPDDGGDEEDAISSTDIINEFLGKSHEQIVIHEEDSDDAEEIEAMEPQNAPENEILTETLAHIYIKQGKFDKAIEIIRGLSLKYPKKNRYFADQIRFMEKVIINNRNK